MTYPTLDYLPDLTLNERLSAGTLHEESMALFGWDHWYSAYGEEPYAILHDIYKFTATKDSIYGVASCSYYDPFILEVYDSSGNVICVNDESKDIPGTSLGGVYYNWDSLTFTAPYTGTYYVSAGWAQGPPPYSLYGVYVYEHLTSPSVPPPQPPPPSPPPPPSGGHIINGTPWDDSLTGTSGADKLYGKDGNDILSGGDGNDLLSGGSGNDKLIGGKGNDTLIGGSGRDTLTGGSGADHFDFNSISDSGITDLTNDLILDFSHAQHDKIDLHDIDANIARAGNQNFTFIGAAQFSSNATGQVRFDSITNTLYASVDADQNAELSIHLAGVNHLSASDFIL